MAAALRARFAVAVAVLAMAGCLVTAPPASAAGSGSGPNQALVNLGHAGRFLTDPAGQAVVLHGLNMVAKVAPYEPAAVGFGIQAARSLAANGFDVVRLGVIYAVSYTHLDVYKRQGRYKTAALTNNFVAGGNGRGRGEDAPNFYEGLFDVVIESSKIGVRKPDPRFYELACETLDVLPTESVFLDDLGINLKPAREMGMHTLSLIHI